MITIEVTGLGEAEVKLGKIGHDLTAKMPSLMRTLGLILRNNVQDRMKSADSGTWAGPSKWTKAKKHGVTRALQGMDKFVAYLAVGNTCKIEFFSPGDWTLEQHQEGFTNQLIGEEDEIDSFGKVVIQLVNPSYLNRDKRGPFSWFPSNIGHTPARKIYPNESEAMQAILPAVTAWANKVVEGGANVFPIGAMG